MTETDPGTLLSKVVQIAKDAGAAIMAVYSSEDFAVERKDDNSPLTKADKAAHKVIVSALEDITNYPIISEEGENRTVDGQMFWLVDPLDGTKEFIKRNGEFTVNIALIKNSRPVLGVVYAPAQDICYVGNVDAQQAYCEHGTTRTHIEATADQDKPIIVTSRSHKDDATKTLLEAIANHQEIAMGSSLKLCAVAEGKAALYPRLGPTSLWDTAAADAVVTAAGGAVKSLDGSVLLYDPNTAILNPSFVVESKNNQIAWQASLR